jgi:hypothetical protein
MPTLVDGGTAGKMGKQASGVREIDGEEDGREGRRWSGDKKDGGAGSQKAALGARRRRSGARRRGDKKPMGNKDRT